MEAIVKNSQSLVDVAIEHLGSADLALDVALLNGISLTDALEPGTSLLLPDVKPQSNSEALPVVAVVTEASLLQLLTAHTSILGGLTAGHVRNGGDVRIDTEGRMWVSINASTDGREVELQKSLTHIQWRYVGDVTWTNLVALSEITGANGSDGSVGGNGIDGKEVEFQKSSTHIQWRYIGDLIWSNLVALTELKGDTGAPGATVESGISMAVRTVLTGETLQANADIIELNMYRQINISTVNGTISLPCNSTTNLTATLTNSHTIAILPDVPTTQALAYAPNTRINFKIGATLPSITISAPSGVTYTWRRTQISVWGVNKYYTILFVWKSSTECDIFYIIS